MWDWGEYIFLYTVCHRGAGDPSDKDGVMDASRRFRTKRGKGIETGTPGYGGRQLHVRLT